MLNSAHKLNVNTISLNYFPNYTFISIFHTKSGNILANSPHHLEWAQIFCTVPWMLHFMQTALSHMSWKPHGCTENMDCGFLTGQREYEITCFFPWTQWVFKPPFIFWSAEVSELQKHWFWWYYLLLKRSAHTSTVQSHAVSWEFVVA